MIIPLLCLYSYGFTVTAFAFWLAEYDNYEYRHRSAFYVGLLWPVTVPVLLLSRQLKR